MNLLLANYLVDSFEPFYKWITIGILGALIVTGIVVYFAKRDIFGKYAKYALIGFVFYALAASIFMLVLDLIKHYDTAYLDKNYVSKAIIPFVFIPSIATLSIALISGIVLFTLDKLKPEALQKATLIVGIVLGAMLITTLIMIAIFFANNIVGDGYYTDEEYGRLDSVMLYVSAGALIVISVIVAFFTGRKEKGFDSKSLAFAGITVALSFVLSYVKLFSMPQGGSITLASMLPIMLFAYACGPKKGLLIGAAYGLLQAIQSPYIVHPAQFLLDYPVAFMMIGYAGVFRNLKGLDNLPQIKFGLGAALAGVMRFISHVLSGVFAFGAYAVDEGFTNFWLYSAAYNSFVLVDVAIIVAVAVILFSSKAFIKQVVERYA